jgi:hypothetical protein
MIVTHSHMPPTDGIEANPTSFAVRFAASLTQCALQFETRFAQLDPTSGMDVALMQCAT